MVRIVLANRGPRLSPQARAEALGRLSPDERARIATYRRWEDAQCSLLGGLLLRDLAAGYLPQQGHGAAPVLHRDRLGRPFVSGSARQELDLNLSHSGEYIAAAISDAGRIGVDVERERDVDTRAGDPFFTPGEIAYLDALPPGPRISAFFQLWTLKEAYAKALGGGLLEDLRRIELHWSGGTVRMGRVATGEPSSRWRFRTWSPAPGVWLSACAEYAELPQDVERWSL